MNKFFVALIIFAFCVVANAKTTSEASSSDKRSEVIAKKRCYIELKCQQGGYKGSNVKITINIGKMLAASSGYSNDDIAKAIPTTSLVDALNALSIRGWSLAETYSTVTGPQIVSQYWILYKDAADIGAVFDDLFNKR